MNANLIRNAPSTKDASTTSAVTPAQEHVANMQPVKWGNCNLFAVDLGTANISILILGSKSRSRL